MITSHLKTSLRSSVRNKLFTAINILGLAIGMSVGLLLIALIHDLMSYDRFNEKGSRIYRITSKAQFKEGYRSNFATASVKADQLIRENVSGVEAVTKIQTEFAGDAQTKDVVVPVKG